MQTSYHAYGFEAGRVGFDVVVNGRIVPHTDEGIVRIPMSAHGAARGVPYGIQLSNYGRNLVGLSYTPQRRCKVNVTISGIFQGEWVLQADRINAFLDRGINDTGIWHFAVADSQLGQQMGSSSVAPVDRGLIRVEFIPEHFAAAWQREPGHVYKQTGPAVLGGDEEELTHGVSYSYDTPQPKSLGRSTDKSGITFLKGTSNVKFSTASDFVTDLTLATVLFLRLVANVQDDVPRPLSGPHGGTKGRIPPTIR